MQIAPKPNKQYIDGALIFSEIYNGMFDVRNTVCDFGRREMERSQITGTKYLEEDIQHENIMMKSWHGTNHVHCNNNNKNNNDNDDIIR